MKEEGASRQELARMVERLLAAVERHADDYHYRTPPGLLDEARTLLRRWEGRRGRRGKALGEATGRER